MTTGCFDKGGVSRYSRYQISALRTLAGEENVRVLSILGRGKADFETPFSVTWCGNNPTSKLSNKLGLICRALYESLKWKPDVIVTAHINLSPLALMLARLSGSKTVLNVYGLEIWSGLSKSKKKALAMSDHVISDCHFTKNHIVDNGLRNSKPIHVIWDCVDTTVFQPVEASVEFLDKYGLTDLKNNFIVLTLGRISLGSRHKGFERLITAFKSALQSENNIRLVIAGTGDFLPSLKKMVQDAGITKKVHFTGAVHENDMATMFSIASVFSLVSERGSGKGEGIPLTPLEAMACGVPAIVGNQDGSQEAVVDSKNGWTLDSLDTAAHTNLICKLVRDPLLLQQKSANAQSVITDHFTYPAFVQKHAKLLTDVLNK